MAKAGEEKETLNNPRAGRPDFPEEYGLRDPKIEVTLLSWDWVETQLTEARNYWLGTTRPDGRPHAAPVWGVWHAGAFYFGTGRSSRKALNLSDNPALVVHLESGDEVVILEGEAHLVAEPALLSDLDAVYYAKYQVHLTSGPNTGAQIYTLYGHTAFAWLERDFPSTATRWKISQD